MDYKTRRGRECRPPSAKCRPPRARAPCAFPVGRAYLLHTPGLVSAPECARAAPPVSIQPFHHRVTRNPRPHPVDTRAGDTAWRTAHQHPPLRAAPRHHCQRRLRVARCADEHRARHSFCAFSDRGWSRRHGGALVGDCLPCSSRAVHGLGRFLLLPSSPPGGAPAASQPRPRLILPAAPASALAHGALARPFFRASPSPP